VEKVTLRMACWELGDLFQFEKQVEPAAFLENLPAAISFPEHDY
jgi:hypothetical protein